MIHIHILASLQRRQRRVDLQRHAQVPRACIADVVEMKAAHEQVSALAKVVGLPFYHCNCNTPTPPHIHSHIPASLQLRQRRVDPQRRAQVPRACSANAVPTEAAHVQV
jgi:hypothetical protein